MLPISGATLYMGKYKDKVKNVVDSIDENSNQWKHFVSNKSRFAIISIKLTCLQIQRLIRM